MFRQIFILIFSAAVLLISCNSNKASESGPQADGSIKATVQEVVQASSYTYLRVKAGAEESWLAVTKRDLEPGITVYFRPELQMENFNSKDLNRTFEKIYFVNELSSKPLNAAPAGQPAMSGRPAASADASISVEPAANGLTIAQISEQRNELANKKITVRGQVTKFNAQIMGHNWVHIQDGTSDGQTVDLTITTDNTVKVGDVVTFKGILVLNKDFGAGYSYDMIMQQAELEN